MQASPNPLDRFLITRVVKKNGQGRTYTSNLQSFDGPVIMFAGGHGFGPEMLETAGLLSNANVTMNYKEDYGHVDHVFSTKHMQEVEHPVLAWLLHDVE